MIKFKILRLAIRVRESASYYNNFCLAAARHHRITLCSMFKPESELPPTIRVISGDGTIGGYRKLLDQVVRRDSYDLVHSHYPHTSFLYLLNELVGRKQAMPPLLHTVHSSYANHQLRHRALLSMVMARATQVNYCSQASRDSFPAWWFRIPTRPPEVIQNGVDLKRIDRVFRNVGPRENKEQDQVKAVVVGRLISCKNLDMLIQAIALTQKKYLSVSILGEGPLRSKLQRQIKHFGLEDRVRLLGHVSLDAVYRTIIHADFMIHISRREGLPKCVLEAMACCKPVILSAIPPHREIAQETSIISLVDCDDVPSMAAHLDHMTSLEPYEREQLGQQCRAIVEHRFSLERMHEQYRHLYETIISSNPPSTRRLVA